jgi:hypothetical protein
MRLSDFRGKPLAKRAGQKMKIIQKMISRGALVLALATNFTLEAQSTNPAPWVSYSVFKDNPYALFVISNLLAEPPPELRVPELSMQVDCMPGTYWTLKGAHVPWPANPFPELPVYPIGTNSFLVDDRSVDYTALAVQRQAEVEAEGLTNYTISAYTFDTNGLWLEVPTNSLADSGQFKVILHNSLQGQNYNVLTKSDLLCPMWTTELTVTGAVGSVTEAELPMNGRTDLFVRACVSTAYSFYLVSLPLSQEVIWGDTVTFSVETGGNTNLTYQWLFNGEPIAGATNSSYTISKVHWKDGGSYACMISDGTNTLITAAGTLSVYRNYNLAVWNQRQDYTFKSGVTYLILGQPRLYGHTTIEAGAILKFDWFFCSSLQVLGTLECKGEPYNPAILTSVDDDTTGDALIDPYSGFSYSWEDGPPQIYETGFAYLNLFCARSSSISNLRIEYADGGVTTSAVCRRLDVWDCQFVQCNYGVVDLVDGSSTNSLHNVLFSACNAAVGASTNAIDLEAEQVTAAATNFWLTGVMPRRVALTNSILWDTHVYPNGSLYSFVNVAFNPGPTNFQTADAGRYYLAANSPLHRAGTANISPRLQNELKGKTTYAPVALAAYITLTGDLTLSPQAVRYTNGAPDVGYHYDALDYTVGAFILAGGTVRVLPGTAIGLRDYSYDVERYNWWGFWVERGSAFVSHGSPNRPIIYSDVQLVQEQPADSCVALFVPDYEPGWDPTAPPPDLDFRFCHFYAASTWYHLWSGNHEYYTYNSSPYSLVNWNLQDCELHGGKINLGLPNDLYWALPGSCSVTWRNNLFDNVSINLTPTYYRYIGTVNCDLQFQAFQNLFRGGMWFYVQPIPATAGNWVFKDNLFDKVDFLQDTNAPLDFDHNGYWPLTDSELWWLGDASQLQPSTGGNLSGSHDVVLTSAPQYQAGPFGNYYLPDTTPLYGAGSTNAGEIGLAQYTTSPNQTKEDKDHPVNIGLHYVAAAGNQPLDSDGDGVPDYVEDANGNGNRDGNETDLTLVMTDGSTPDAYSSVYDDVDLSGNGLVGRIKKALGMNPLDPSNPFTLKQVITGEEPDIATFEVPVSYDLLTNIAGLQLLVDGKAVSWQECDRNTNDNCLLAWNTTYNSPGQHYLQAILTLKEVVPLLDETSVPLIATAPGQIIRFYSENVIQFHTHHTGASD